MVWLVRRIEIAFFFTTQTINSQFLFLDDATAQKNKKSPLLSCFACRFPMQCNSFSVCSVAVSVGLFLEHNGKSFCSCSWIKSKWHFAIYQSRILDDWWACHCKMRRSELTCRESLNYKQVTASSFMNRQLDLTWIPGQEHNINDVISSLVKDNF